MSFISEGDLATEFLLSCVPNQPGQEDDCRCYPDPSEGRPAERSLRLFPEPAQLSTPIFSARTDQNFRDLSLHAFPRAARPTLTEPGTERLVFRCKRWVSLYPALAGNIGVTVRPSNNGDPSKLDSRQFAGRDYFCRVFSWSSARFNSSSFFPASASLPSAVRRW